MIFYYMLEKALKHLIKKNKKQTSRNQVIALLLVGEMSVLKTEVTIRQCYLKRKILF